MPRSVACAVVHDEPPTVFVAEDLETLNWVLALNLIARTRGSEIAAHTSRDVALGPLELQFTPLFED